MKNVVMNPYLPIREDGWFDRAEITSCGLNNGPLPDDREYNVCYCCRGFGHKRRSSSVFHIQWRKCAVCSFLFYTLNIKLKEIYYG
jgi:hypothetical protein